MNRSGTPNQNRPPLNSSGSASSDSNNDSAYKAALRGASLAFQNTSSKQPPNAPSSQARSIDSRALIAATSASHHYGLSPSRSPPRMRPSAISQQTTGSSSRSTGTSGQEIEHGALVQRLKQQSSQQSLRQHQAHAAAQLLMPPGKQAGPDAKSSPSFIAATLAASRSASPSRQPAQSHPHAQQAAVRRQQQAGGDAGGAHSAATSVASLDLTAGTAPLPSANALISMFEKKDGDTDPVKKRTAVPKDDKPPVLKPKPKPKPKPHPVTPVKAPNPAGRPDSSPSKPNEPTRERSVSPPLSIQEPARERSETQRGPAGQESKKPPPTPPPPRSTRSAVDESPSARAAASKRRPRASTPPRPISSANTVILSPQPRRASSQRLLSPKDSDDSLASQPKALPPAVKPKLQPRAPVQYAEKSSAPLKESPRPIMLAEKERRLSSSSTSSSSSSDDTFVSASSAPSQRPVPPRHSVNNLQLTPNPPRLIRPSSTQSTPAPRPHRSPLPPPPLPQRSQQNASIPLDSLTSAIMAGSIANSRLAPARATPPRPPSPPSRLQTPRMRQTLRRPLASLSDGDDDEGRHHHHHHHHRRHHHYNYNHRHRGGKKPFGQKGKHAHHEGQRKRWRDEITPRERKRYEGVWASNRGYLLDRDKDRGAAAAAAATTAGELQQQQQRDASLPSTAQLNQERGGGGGGEGEDSGELVANVVVRDIWARSRLPADELAEVWDLVDGRGRGALDRAQFVVGMWLIDQRLRGRKIPRKVSDSVWGSARGGGVVSVRVRAPKGGKGR